VLAYQTTTRCLQGRKPVITDGNDRLAYKLVLEGKLTTQQIADFLKVSISSVYRARRRVAKELQPPPTDDAKVSVRLMSSGCLLSLVCMAGMQWFASVLNSCKSKAPVGVSYHRARARSSSSSTFYMTQALADMKQAIQAARFDMAKAVAKWPDIPAEVWRRLSPDGWCNAIVTAGPSGVLPRVQPAFIAEPRSVGSSMRT